MKQPQHRYLGLILILVVLVAASACVAAPRRPNSKVLLEGSWVNPYGDLAKDFTRTPDGFGATDGLELGFRWRYYFSKTVSLAPAFHFVDYLNFKSEDPDLGAYFISVSSQRYTLELMIVQGAAEKKRINPFLAVSAGWFRNRATGFDKALITPFDETVHTVGVGVRAGVQVGAFELSAVYNRNRFDSVRFFQPGSEIAHNWDSFAVRVGWVVPFSDGPAKKK